MSEIVGEAVVRIRAETSDVENNIKKLQGIATTEGQQTGEAVHAGIKAGVDKSRESLAGLEAHIVEVKNSARQEFQEVQQLEAAGLMPVGSAEKYKQHKQDTIRLVEQEAARQRQVVESVERSTKAVKEEVAAAKEGVGFFQKIGDAVDKKTEGMRKFQGALSGAVGIATGLLGIGTAIIAVIAKWNESYWEGVQALKEQREATRQMREEMNASLAEARGINSERALELALLLELDKRQRDIRNQAREGTIEAAEAYQLLRDEEELYNYKVKKGLEDIDKARRDANEAEYDRKKALFNETAALEAQVMDGVEKLHAEHIARREAVYEKMAKSKDQIEVEQYQKQLRLLEKLYEQDLSTHNDALRAKARAETEARDKKIEEDKKAALQATRETNALIRDLMNQQTYLEDFATGTVGLLQKIDTRLLELQRKQAFAGPMV